jgi:hypothetical protein
LNKEDIVKQIKEVLVDVSTSKIEFLGPEIYIYTKNLSKFYEDDKYISSLAFALKKKVNIRSDVSELMDLEQAKDIIMKAIPEDAGVSAVYFDTAFAEVVIEANKPGLVIGKGGLTSKKIIQETKWTPVILRKPVNESQYLKKIRGLIYKYSAERKKNMAFAAEKIFAEKKSKKDWVRFCALGAFREVGRSCILLETANSRVILDCGVNPGNNGDSYPELQSLGYTLNDIDAVVISHAHTDHAAFVPYLYRMGYKGPVYCTPPTRDLMYILMFDYLNVAVKEGSNAPYNESDVNEMLKHVITREYEEVTDITPDIRLTFHNAAHILGSASVHLHIGDGSHNLMYSGDLKFGFTRLFNNLEQKYPRLETLILESTYAGNNDVMPQRNVAEDRLIDVINNTVKRNGNVLIPVFGVGRSQEVMLVLEEYYRRKKLLTNNVYLAGIIKEVCAVHTVYPDYFKDNLKRRVLQNNSPFSCPIFKDIASRNELEEVSKTFGNVFLATSGMLVGGASVELLHKFAENKNNTLIFVGWQSEGSIGRRLQEGLKEITITDSNGKLKRIPVNMEVVTIEGFSGHCDRNQLTAYIKNLNPMPKRIYLDHGEEDKSVSFAKYVSSKFGISCYAPKNLECLRIR